MSLRRSALLAVRELDTEPGPAQSPNPGYLGPVVPAGWKSVAQAGGWYAVALPDGARIAVNRINTSADGTRGLFLVCGPRPILDQLAASSDLIHPMVDTWALALAGPGLAREVMRRWRWYRVSGFRRDPETGDPVAITQRDLELIPEGGTLPDPATDPLPWDLDGSGALVPTADAVVRVTAIHRPACLRTIAGYADHVDAVETAA